MPGKRTEIELLKERICGLVLERIVMALRTINIASFT